VSLYTRTHAHTQIYFKRQKEIENMGKREGGELGVGCKAKVEGHERGRGGGLKGVKSSRAYS